MSFTKILSTAGLFVALAGTGLQAETLTAAHGLAPKHPIAENGMAPWMECVRKDSSGQLDFNELPSGQVVDYKFAIDALNSGLADISVVVVAYSSDKLPVNGIVNLPSSAKTGIQMTEAWRAEIDAGGAFADEIAQAGIHPILLNVQPPQQMVSRRGKISSAEDFKGLLIRAAGGSTNVMIQALGGTPVEIGLPDLYTALQRGTIDAGPVALTSIRTYAIDEVVNAISTNGSFSTGSTIFAMSQARYDKLSDEQKRIVDDCGRNVEASLSAKLEELNTAAVTEIAARGVEMYEFTPEMLATIAATYEPVGADYVKRLEDRGLSAGDAYNSYRSRLAE